MYFSTTPALKYRGWISRLKVAVQAKRLLKPRNSKLHFTLNVHWEAPCWSKLKPVTQTHSSIRNVSSFRSFPWFSMYSLMISSVSDPTVLQKYPGAHKCCPQYRFLRSWNSSCSIFDERPFRYCSILLGAIVGGHDNSRCTCSFPICPLTILIFLASQPCRISSLSRSAIRPCSTLYRYFVVHTTWYSISYTVWLPYLIYPTWHHPVTILPEDTQVSASPERIHWLKVSGFWPGAC